MSVSQQIIFFTEIIGTIAFAFSGATVAIRRRMDIFGVLVLGGCTAVGGGLIRDLILGNIPPSMFRKPVYVAVSAITSLAVFILIRRNNHLLEEEGSQRFLRFIELMDAIGLGAFTVVGVNTAVELGYENNSFLMVFVAVLTGAGGGILRDVLGGITPIVLRKRVYALASIAGAIVHLMLMKPLGSLAMFAGAGVVVLIRFLAARYRWDLPVAIPKHSSTAPEGCDQPVKPASIKQSSPSTDCPGWRAFA